MKALAFSDLPVAILCGGLGTRLGEETQFRPKSMVDINGKPFIHRQLDLLMAMGFTRFVLCIGHLGNHFFGRMGNYPVSYSLDGNIPLGTAGAVRNALPMLGDEFWTLYGDSYLDADFAPVFEGHRKYDLMGCFTEWKHVNYGMNLFKREAFEMYSEETNLHSLIATMLHDERAVAFDMGKPFLEIGSPEGLAEVRKLLT